MGMGRDIPRMLPDLEIALVLRIQKVPYLLIVDLRTAQVQLRVLSPVNGGPTHLYI